MNTVESVALFYRDGNSDKVYQAQIVEEDAGFSVNFQYGRRGSTLQSGTKTASPVSRLEAEKIYSKLVDSKTAKGYTAEEGVLLGSDGVFSRVLDLLRTARESD